MAPQFTKDTKHGGVAQMARACGSYPQCRWFNSNRRYSNKNKALREIAEPCFFQILITVLIINLNSIFAPPSDEITPDINLLDGKFNLSEDGRYPLSGQEKRLRLPGSPSRYIHIFVIHHSWHYLTT